MIEVLVVIIIVGVVLWFANQYLPMAPPFKAGLNILAAIFLLIYVLRAFGLFHGGPSLR